MDLEYRDRRKDQFIREFSDVAPSKVPDGIRKVTNAAGMEVDELDTKALMTTLKLVTKRLQAAEQEIASLRGQLEYIYKNGLDGYADKIQTIRDENPK